MIQQTRSILCKTRTASLVIVSNNHKENNTKKIRKQTYRSFT